MAETMAYPIIIDIQVKRQRNSELIKGADFGNVYLGETLVGVVTVDNKSELFLKDVALRVEVQTNTQRLRLTRNDTGVLKIDELKPRDQFVNTITHEITEMGPQILISEVSCLPPNGEKADFSKYIKYYVQKPLDVKTKFYSAESEEVYLEAQVQNVTAGSIQFLKVNFDPSPLFSVRGLNAIGEASIFDPIDVVEPQGIRQYLFCLRPVNERKATRGVSTVGKLDVEWLTEYGDKGRLQTSQLQRMAPGFGDLRLTIEELPNPVKLHSFFKIRLRVTNTCERPISLVLSLENSGPALLWLGISESSFEPLEPWKHHEFVLGVLANHPGLQTISGIRLTDTFLKRNHDYDDIGQVVVIA
ncbi:trafficking protein particle complex subunit 13-like [Artemia franciscana]|uniref:Uncharacterized protein n=1 Tax=Artemia franciscana TaxID=6661 RepID=A0AA88KXG0_ARTSF|nr:hypothetical protein QYM36_015990 [Artemia franciscana]KAK2705825.1 hypothetical protein QYM36_015990 [Artemia franciscana]KAK2705826.1 hypothetical protein QYM36_015990 [Artemia franciscana]KAK2705827.1 hypothetical protein QYM36_015990 [Artemia franciscana]